MKILGLIFGIFVAWTLNKWAPGVLSFADSPSLLSYVSTLVGALSALWLVALGRLSAFEKLEDLTGNQKAIALAKAKKFRRAILASIGVNAFFLVATVIFVAISPTIKTHIASFMSFWLIGCLGIWLGGFVQSLRCIDNIEQSRLAIVATQDAEKRRNSYLKKMREDEAKAPVDTKDPNLKPFASSHPNPV